MSKPAITSNKPTLNSSNRPTLGTGKPKLKPGVSSFDQLFIPTPQDDPLAEFEYTDNPEVDAVREASAILDGFQQRAKREQERFELSTDSEFWCAICFQSREQKEIFLQALDWLQHGDKYLDGLALAQQMNIELPKVDLPKPKRFSQKLTRLSTNLGKMLKKGGDS